MSGRGQPTRFLVSLTIADKHVTGIGIKDRQMCGPTSKQRALLQPTSIHNRRPRVVKLCIELCTSTTSAQTPPAPTLTVAACPRRRPRSFKLSPAAISAMAQRTPDSPSLSAGSGSPSLPSGTSHFRRMLARLRKTVSHLSAAPRGREHAANVDRCLHISSSTERKQHFKPSKHHKQGLDIDWIQGEELRERVERKFQRYHLYRTDSCGRPWCAS